MPVFIPFTQVHAVRLADRARLPVLPATPRHHPRAGAPPPPPRGPQPPPPAAPSAVLKSQTERLPQPHVVSHLSQPAASALPTAALSPRSAGDDAVRPSRLHLLSLPLRRRGGRRHQVRRRALNRRAARGAAALRTLPARPQAASRCSPRRGGRCCGPQPSTSGPSRRTHAPTTRRCPSSRASNTRRSSARLPSSPRARTPTRPPCAHSIPPPPPRPTFGSTSTTTWTRTTEGARPELLVACVCLCTARARLHVCDRGVFACVGLCRERGTGEPVAPPFLAPPLRCFRAAARAGLANNP